MRLGRRDFLRSAAVTAAVACAPSAPAASSATPVPSPGALETTTLRIAGPAGCDPWTWLVDDFLKDEGFTDVALVSGKSLVKGEVDLSVNYGNSIAAHVDAGNPMIALGGTHVGCVELWARPGISTVRDLRGKNIVVAKKDPLVDVFYGLWVSLLTSVGVDPSEVNILEQNDLNIDVIDFFVDGRSDATLTAVTQGPALRAHPKNPGKQIFDTAMDKPWSQYYCCMLVANRDWAKANPNATKRATRAILRAIDLGAKDRPRAVQVAVEKKITQNPQRLLEAIKDLPYQWRDYDAEETLRFFSLRLAEGKLIKKTPQQIIAEGSDFAWFKHLQKELKA